MKKIILIVLLLSKCFSLYGFEIPENPDRKVSIAVSMIELGAVKGDKFSLNLRMPWNKKVTWEINKLAFDDMDNWGLTFRYYF